MAEIREPNWATRGSASARQRTAVRPRSSPNPKPLTTFDPDYPYIEPAYQLNEAREREAARQAAREAFQNRQRQ
jgi:hypothetical protein